MVSSTGPVRNARSCCRSASVWNSRFDPACAALAAALSTGAPSFTSASTAILMRMRRRVTSSSTWPAMAPTTTITSMTRVSMLRLARTRSEIWNRKIGMAEDKQVHGDREHADGDEIAPAGREPLRQNFAKIGVARLMLHRRRCAAAATAAAAIPPPPPPSPRRRSTFEVEGGEAPGIGGEAGRASLFASERGAGSAAGRCPAGG